MKNYCQLVRIYSLGTLHSGNLKTWLGIRKKINITKNKTEFTQSITMSDSLIATQAVKESIIA